MIHTHTQDSCTLCLTQRPIDAPEWLNLGDDTYICDDCLRRARNEQRKLTELPGGFYQQFQKREVSTVESSDLGEVVLFRIGRIQVSMHRATETASFTIDGSSFVLNAREILDLITLCEQMNGAIEGKTVGVLSFAVRNATHAQT